MITNSGRGVYPSTHKDFTEAVAPSLEDIAVGLGRIPRFAGQVPVHYTVLCHTLTVAQITTPAARIYSLLHDAPEAVVSDVPTPWKSMQAIAYEHEIMGRICAEHNILWPPPCDLWDEVRACDAAALAVEAHMLGHPKAQECWPTSDFKTRELMAISQTKINLKLMPHVLEPDNAIAVFLSAFTEAKDLMRDDARILATTSKEQ